MGQLHLRKLGVHTDKYTQGRKWDGFEEVRRDVSVLALMITRDPERYSTNYHTYGIRCKTLRSP
jgi:hypothetical protein